MRIGVIGYSAQKFDVDQAEYALDSMIMGLSIKERRGFEEVAIVSGLTNLGVPAIAYHIAKCRGMKTVGIACSKAKNYDCFACDEVKIVGDNWGDESEAFLNDIDVLVKVGGGKQSLSEIEKAKTMGIPCFEYHLDAKVA